MIQRIMILIIGCCFALPAPTLHADERPNIVWVSTEDISSHIGCYGDPHAKTPVIDALAKQGVRYTHAYTIAGVCAPSRSGIIMGMYPSSMGSMHMRCKANAPKGTQTFVNYLRDAGYYCTNRSKTDYNLTGLKGVWDQSNNKAHWKGRKKGQPFFAVFNFTTTHESRIVFNDKSYANATKRLTSDQRLAPEDVNNLPPYYPDTPVVRKDWARNYELITAMDYQVGDIIKQLKEEGLWENTIVIFWSDHGIGLPRAKRWLYDSGTRVPLVVRIPKKYRINEQGKPGTVDNQLVSMIDLGPTMLNLAGIKVPEYMHGRAFLGKGLTQPRDYVYGARDRMDERYDIIRSVRDQRYRYIRNYEPFKAYYQYMNTPEGGPTMKELRKLHAADKLPPAAELFMADHKPAEELYDLEKDPHEINNLADDSKYADTLKRMRKAHEDWVIETRDVGLIPEPLLVKYEKQFGDRYSILRQPNSKRLIETLRDVADSASRGPKAKGKLVSALEHQHPAVRYWGLIGLGNIAEQARDQHDRIKGMLQDEEPIVRIAAARALCHMDDTKDALTVLKTELAHKEQWTRLNAAIVLDEIDEQAKPAVPALKEALKDKQNKYVVRVANRALNQLLGTQNKVR